MGKRLGNLIRSARTGAGLTQAQLAERVPGASTTDIGRFERVEAEPVTQVVKDIAKACGVTQKSLLAAMPKTSTTTSSTSSGQTMRVSATERRLVEAYRAATPDARKLALQVLKGESSNMDVMISNIGSLIGRSEEHTSELQSRI